MAIHFVTGNIGGGKGLYCMQLILEELRGRNRPIVTNFPLLQKDLARALELKYQDSFDLCTRLHMIESKHEIRNFFRIRGVQHDDESKWLAAEIDKKGKPVAYDIDGANKGGVFYLLDEVHLVFGARDWQDMGRAVMFYASQSRKLGDDVVLVTQVPGNVDKQLRTLSQDFTVIRNHGMEKLSWFKAPSVFSVKTYMNLPMPGNKESPMVTSHFRLNTFWADCYETAKGVGIVNPSSADKGKDKRKGIPWYWGFIGLAVIMYGLFWIVTGGFKYLTGNIDGLLLGKDGNATKEANSTLKIDSNKTKSMSVVEAYLKRRSENEVRLKTKAKTEQDKARQVETVQDKAGQGETGQDKAGKGESKEVPVEIQIEGYMVTRYRGENQAVFRLTNGRILKTGSGQIKQLSANGIIDIKGISYPWNPKVYFDPDELFGY